MDQGQIPTPTTVGELSILMMSELSYIKTQLDGLPARVQALEYEVKDIKQTGIDRKALVYTWLGLGATLAASVAGVIVR